MSRQSISLTVLWMTIIFAGLSALAQGRIEMGVADSFVVEGKTGSKTDPDVTLAGYTLFGTNAAGAVAVTSGVGNVYIQNSLEIGSSLYLRGNGLIFPDATTQATANVISPLSSLVSGECDTNRLDILVGTNYVITGVKVMQTSVIPQFIQVYSNGTVVGSFALATSTAASDLSLNLAAYDRLGIACSNLNGTVLFVFEGRRP